MSRRWRSDSAARSLFDGIAIALLVVVSLAGWMPFAGAEAVVVTFTDDAFYYAQIARNVAEGSGFTFDGISSTNGFQPLWLLALSVVFRMVPGDLAPLRIIVLLQASLASFAAVMLFTLLRHRLGSRAAFVSALMVAAQPGSREFLCQGMESSLLLAALMLAWRTWDAVERRPGTRPCVLFSLAALIAFLARVEAIVLIPVTLAWGWAHVRRRPGILAPLVGPWALGVAAYVTWNRLAFDTWLPISGIAKRWWLSRALTTMSIKRTVLAIGDVSWFGSQIVCRLFHCSTIYYAPRRGIVLAGVLALAAVMLLLAMRRAFVAHDVVLPLLWAFAIHVAHKASVLFLGAWQQVPVVVVTAVVTGVLVARVSHRLARVAVVAATLATLVKPVATWSYIAHPECAFVTHATRAAEWTRQNTPAGARIGSWNAGAFGYFSHRHVINLDGLVNDLDFYRRALRGGGIERYLDAKNVTWLADANWQSAHQPAIWQAMVSSPPRAHDFEVAFPDEGLDGCNCFMVWRITRRPGATGEPRAGERF